MVSDEMVVTVDLGPLPYKLAREIIFWCAKHGHDQEKCLKIIDYMRVVAPTEEIDWVVTLPEKHFNWFLLKHS